MIWGRAIFIKDVAPKGQWEAHIGEGERVHIVGIGELVRQGSWGLGEDGRGKERSSLYDNTLNP